MASRSFKVTYALHPNQTGDGSFTLSDPHTFVVGNLLSIHCAVDGKTVTDFSSESFQPGGQVALDVTLRLNKPESNQQITMQSEQIDEVLDGLVDFAQSQPPSLRTLITGLLFRGSEVVLEGTVAIPAAAAEPSAGIAPDLVPATVAAPAESPASVSGAASVMVPSVIPVPGATPASPAGTTALPVIASGGGSAATSTGIVPPDTDSASGAIAPADYVIQNPVTLQRTTRPVTGDVALWLMIKINADYLGWANYEQQIGLLFGTDGYTETRTPGTMLERTQRLSRRRFLPFTDTDAYRALKVATEAFVVTWGGVVPDNQDFPSAVSLLLTDQYAINLASERLGIDITQPSASTSTSALEAMSHQYFGDSMPPTLPYLTRVVDGLRGSDAGTYTQEVQKQVTDAKEQGHGPVVHPNFCGETCLWLAQLNHDISAKLTRPPLIELIWSYWMEELQLVQTMNAISRRFQNVSSGPRDPLAQLELDPVRSLNNMIWGWVQDEQHRLPIERRAAEYQHEYGFRIFGRAVPTTHNADVRSKFLAAFHTLLNLCVPFFRQADDTTVVPDGFPLLNALREVHLILSEGAHNQFRDLPSTSRIEMMMQQWILARPEFREFLPRRAMVAYPEPWMHSVESMRKLQGWGDTNTYQFWQLATTGEQIVSSIRWGNWNSIDDPNNAANWAVFFRPEIQTYIHSYRAVTGVDVSAEPVDVQIPGMHLLRRMHEQQRIKAA